MSAELITRETGFKFGSEIYNSVLLELATHDNFMSELSWTHGPTSKIFPTLLSFNVKWAIIPS